MLNRFKNKILSIIFIILIIGTGCEKVETQDNNQPEYINVALNKLQEKYGEEFEVSHIGGSFGATRDTYKLICNPINNINQKFNVEVSRNLTNVEDGYIGNIMAQKLEKKLNDTISTILGEEVNVKLDIDGMFTKYESDDMDVLEYLKENKGTTIASFVFINKSSDIGFKEEADKIYKVMEEILSLFENNITISFIYTKEKCFNNIEQDYYEQKNYGLNNLVDYYKIKDNSYTRALGRNSYGKVQYSKEEIELKLQENYGG